MKAKKTIELSSEQIGALMKRLTDRSLEEADYETLHRMIENLLYLRNALEEKSISVRKLLRMLFGPFTESAAVFRASDGSKKKRVSAGKRKNKSKKKVKGHGRNGKEDFPGALKVSTPHPDLRSGEDCPGCGKGKVYKSVAPEVLLRFTASVPVQATVYEQEKFRCNLCGEIFKAPAPDEACKPKYDETVGPMIAVLKYGNGLPFNRIEKLQENMGIPLPASTQWEIASAAGDVVAPVHEELIRQAAQGEIVQNDDTTMKIMTLMNIEDSPDGENEPERTGLYTTGILSKNDERTIALYFTGRKHAGENLNELLKQREEDRAPPIQMCDAASRNLPESFQTILSNCLVHGRRKFIDATPVWPEECRHVIEALGRVFHVEERAKRENLTPDERLKLHQDESGPVMDELKIWMQNQLDQRKVEPNSRLGKAFNYMKKHWEPLTLFLRIEGAPIHNNLCEQAIKRAILHRKNSLFYKTRRGAEIGDIFMSIIHTCVLAEVNSFDYLTALQLHREDVRKNPELWMPWNFRDGSINKTE